MSLNHPANRLLTLGSILECPPKFFGSYKDPLSSEAIVIENESLKLETLAMTLAELTGSDEKDAYNLLLMLNACKQDCYFADYNNIANSIIRHTQAKNSGLNDSYKIGVEEVDNFADFEKEIEKNIAYLLYNYNKNNEVSERRL